MTKNITEKDIADSLERLIWENRMIKVASRVPIPKIDTGIIATKAEIETQVPTYKYDIFIQGSNKPGLA